MATGHLSGASRDHWNPYFVLKKRRYDLGVTYDGFYIASERFKAVADTLPGRQIEAVSIQGHALPGVGDFTVVVCRPTLPGHVFLTFDGHRRTVDGGSGWAGGGMSRMGRAHAPDGLGRTPNPGLAVC
ncbi:hypothetical protein NSY55_27090, partial [Pseudomonas aeruginosa]|nr:hypothetical protein [Pseudomonas aeruginosa]